MEQQNVPEKAFTLATSDIEITESADESSAATLYDVRLLARSSGSIEHWYWGNQTIHDMDGMRVAEKIPIDFNHDVGEVIGYLDSFQVEKEGLVARGKLVSFSDDDRAAEVAKKSRAGIPWQASINFGGDGISVERISTEGEFTVNNRNFTGDATVIRQWPLRGVAVTPYGADENTDSIVLTNQGERVINLKETNMSDDQNTNEELQEVAQSELETVDELETDAAEEAQADEQQVDEVCESDDATEQDIEAAEPALEAAALSADDGRRYIELFGEIGAVWFIDGKSIAECYALSLAEMTELVAELTDENEKLRQAVTADAESKPLAFSAAEDAEVRDARDRAERFKKNGVSNDLVAHLAGRIEKQLETKSR